ncbi:hypothetical protein [Mucilaginibacter ginsenosidivorans]|uniref:Uncharacterized protein n=1 Tax=Mucilaginibacter ginsenosidivorans TaxID=398053 RepID=A0A5B8UZ48_9SPHI|nr:hypothetical protein [Mucilaginibacter ginsenosidivorans]QEC63641.1 hypothetical protein FRZ54_13995 [Mucilaginibacter ginsenosidivorans]
MIDYFTVPIQISDAMIPTEDPPFYFSVNHIIKPHASKLIYGIRYHEVEYFILKTHGINDCEQLDSNAALKPEIMEKICGVISAIEQDYKKAPPLEFINIEIFNILARDRDSDNSEDTDRYL